MAEVDANYRKSNDPYENVAGCDTCGTTPTGYYDGINLVAQSTMQTNDTGNAYGLYDMTGNVWEWMQDQSLFQYDRRIRGASFGISAISMTLVPGAERNAGDTAATTGFRVLQSVVSDFYVLPFEDHVTSGPWGGPYAGMGNAQSFTITHASEAETEYTISTDVPWISIVGASAGTLADGCSATFECIVQPSCDQPLPVGEQIGTVSIAESLGGTVTQRRILYTVEEPLQVTPATNIDIEADAGDIVVAQSYQIENAGNLPVELEIRVFDDEGAVDWVSILSDPDAEFVVVPALGTISIDVTVDTTLLHAEAHAATIELHNRCTDTITTRQVDVNVRPLFAVEDEVSLLFSGSLGGPFVPLTQTVAITNLVDRDVPWTAMLDFGDPENPTGWMEVTPNSGTLPEGVEPADITLTTTPLADSLDIGNYDVRLVLESGSFRVERDVRLEVSGLLLEPESGATFAGPQGGPFTPAQADYTLTNSNIVAMEWRAEVVEACMADPRVPVPWLSVTPASGIIVNSNGTAAIEVMPTEAATGLTTGTYVGELCVFNFDPDEPAGIVQSSGIRSMRLEVGTNPFVNTVEIPITDVQAGGANHPFRIGRFEVHNALYAAFLNDALNNLDNARGAFMFFDDSTGKVYVHGSQNGAMGEPQAFHETLFFDPGVGDQIEWSDGTYQPVVGTVDYSLHPVAGVTWYGALKYCNWLTLREGFAESQRVYKEAGAGNLDGWHPVTISDESWATRDLSQEERSNLLAYWGFRLPMDDANGAEPSAFGEWLKAASATTDAQGMSVFDSIYGFGRQVITDADANFRCSNDPFESPVDCLGGSTSPIGYYDGVNPIDTGFTSDTGNAYGLYDLTGNVSEWMQDQGSAQGNRRNRGGSYALGEESMPVEVASEQFADDAGLPTGFRVVQSLPDDLYVLPQREFFSEGVWGTTLAGDGNRITLNVTNATDRAVDYAATVDAAWLILAGPVTGTLPARGIAVVEGTVDMSCNELLAPGDREADIRIVDIADGSEITRTLHVSIDEPLQLDPNGSLQFEFEFADQPDDQLLSAFNGSDVDADLSISVMDNDDPGEPGGWILVNGQTETADLVVPAEDTAQITVGIDATLLAQGTHSATLEIRNNCTGQVFPRIVEVTVLPLYDVLADVEGGFAGGLGGPFEPADITVTIENLVDREVSWSISFSPVDEDQEANWLTASPDAGTLPAKGEEAQLSLSLLPEADSLPAGTYGAIMNVESDEGFQVERVIVLDVAQLGVTPVDPVIVTGPRGGPFLPTEIVYTLRNPDFKPLEWNAEIVEDCAADPRVPINWLEVSPTIGVISIPDGTAEITVSLAETAPTLAAGIYQAELCISNIDPNDPGGAVQATAVREIALEVGIEAFSLPMVIIEPEPVQLFGPQHRYRIGRYEVTNAEYARFLNDVELDGGASLKSANVTIDPVTGKLMIQGSGEILFATSNVNPESQINYHPEFVDPGTRYVAGIDKAGHPVTHVSWYGAVKYCNWLTLAQGMDTQLVYAEGPNASDWVPVTAVADDLIALRGFRLPMDAGSDDVDPHNEWLKAASAMIEAELETSFDAPFAFGRDILTPADANYAVSSDPFEQGTTPVGFYDGTTYNSGGDGDIGDGDEFSTSSNNNAYQLYDLCGNVAEWIHDTPNGQHFTRGGHFQNQFDSPRLTNTNRAMFAPTTVAKTIGFRVLQTLPEELPSLTMEEANGLVKVRGYVGGPYEVVNGDGIQTTLDIQITNPGEITADDVALTMEPSSGLFAFVGAVPQQVQANNVAVISLQVDPASARTDPSPAPTGPFSLVRGDLTPVGGPTHDYWISTRETTNTEFASFLTSTLENLSQEQPGSASDFMSFDLQNGDVYLAEQQEGELRYGPPPTPVYIYRVDDGRIAFDGEAYVPQSGYANHPVVGVSWFGAMVYCNWRSRTADIPESLWAYTLAPAGDLDGIHPATVDEASWQAGWTAPDRAVFVDNTLGFRLPMDDQVGGAAPYGEWYQAAAWDPMTLDYSLYGFGRDVVQNTDANFFASEDTQEDGTTPTIFFNGSSTLYQEPQRCTDPEVDPTVTVDTGNGYQLYDMTGNVAEWTQEFGTIANTRATRGGSWRLPVDDLNLLADSRSDAESTGTFDDVGLRVLRGTGHVTSIEIADRVAQTTSTIHLLLDLREPLVTTPGTPVEFQDLYTADFSGIVHTYQTVNRSASEMSWSLSSTQDWLDVTVTDVEELSGTVDGGATLEWTVATNELANNLAPGTHESTVVMANDTTGRSVSRMVTLTIDDAVAAAGEANSSEPHVFTGLFGGPFTTVLDDLSQAGERVVVLSNIVDVPLDYATSGGANWIDVEPVDPVDQLSGTLAAQDSIAFKFSVDESAESLPVDRHTSFVRFAMSDPANESVSFLVDVEIELVINNLLQVGQTCGACVSCGEWEILPDGTQVDICDESLVLTNVYADGGALLEIEIEVDQEWLEVDTELIEIPPGDNNAVAITVRPTELLSQLHAGEYLATITMSESISGASQCRDVALTVTETLAADPFDDFTVRGITGQTTNPQFKVYTITNALEDSLPIDWVVCANQSWVQVAGGASACSGIPAGCSASSAGCGTLDPMATEQIIVSIDTVAAESLGEGTFLAELTIADLSNNVSLSRAIEATFVQPLVNMAQMQPVAAEIIQPLGPSYTFDINAFHTTNAEFVTFLNHAKANPDNEAGQYMFFETSTGDVYVNDAVDGEIGPDAEAVGGLDTLLFSPAASGQVSFDGSSYAVVTAPTDYSDHPVTGVSWYGALKYSNWLTLDQGMFPEDRCYVESHALALTAWRPVTISQAVWESRDLNDEERSQLVAQCRGFRLPMDDGAANAVLSEDNPDEYNEWYKAAAWSQSLQQNTDYGMGINEDDGLTGAHANFKCSGDIFEDTVDCEIGSTTPVGYYDGINLLGDGTPTVDAVNSFGLYDMSGNVFQWLQGRFGQSGGSIALRTVRGGSFNLAEPILRTDFRAWAPVELAVPDIGFRVLRAVPSATGDFNGDLIVDLIDHEAITACMSSPQDPTTVPACTVFDLQGGDGDVDLFDFSVFQNLFSGP
ncbi:MAG: SUMF1/EgtB/PvdO family nonheme iron enzyme [Planctomycetota bacterium]|jgi:formylglycine-generating enzyme required for sulfatase activity